MKTKILTLAAVLVIMATLVGIGTALGASSPNTMSRATAVATIFGVGSIGLFFVGIAYPKD